MLKYRLVGLTLKGFSSCTPARKLYRTLGNRIGGEQRARTLQEYYYDRAQQNVALCKKYVHLQPNDTILELGSGWIHWETLTLRLFFDFKAVLYDVWDNRQLSAFKSRVNLLVNRLGKPGFLDGCDFDRARAIAKEIEKAHSFEDVYSLLGWTFVLDEKGLMENLQPNSFRLIISRGVMEHIPASTADQFVTNIASLLKPGGFAINSINVMDHLYMYDTSVSPKQYLTYSDTQWKRWFENGVQYINRIPRSEWLNMFTNSQLNLIEVGGSKADVTKLPIHPQYQHLNREDLEATTVSIVAYKPAA